MACAACNVLQLNGVAYLLQRIPFNAEALHQESNLWLCHFRGILTSLCGGVVFVLFGFFLSSFRINWKKSVRYKNYLFLFFPPSWFSLIA